MPDLYIRQDGTYRKLTANTITLDPAGMGELNGTDGTFVVYVQASTYTVSEKDLPANTEKTRAPLITPTTKRFVLKAGESATAGFYNHECLGSIIHNQEGTKDRRKQRYPAFPARNSRCTGTAGRLPAERRMATDTFVLTGCPTEIIPSGKRSSPKAM